VGMIGILVLIVFISGCTSISNITKISNTSTSNQSNAANNNIITVKIIYPGQWTGTIDYKRGTQTVEGTGTQSYPLGKNPGFVSVNFQKNDTINETLTAQIVDGNGNVFETQSTSVNQGVVTISHSFSE